MPLPALAVALLALSGSVAVAEPSQLTFAASPPGGLVLVFDDEVYGDHEDDGDDVIRPGDHDHGYGDDENNDSDDSAHGPDDDDDDGWDVDPLNRSERA